RRLRARLRHLARLVRPGRRHGADAGLADARPRRHPCLIPMRILAHRYARGAERPKVPSAAADGMAAEGAARQQEFRAAYLAADRLPPVKARKLHFPEPPPTAPLGAWTLLAPDRMLASATKTSPFVNGECRFEEDRIGPPSRAYLKLWEACTRLGAWPAPGAR